MLPPQSRQSYFRLCSLVIAASHVVLSHGFSTFHSGYLPREASYRILDRRQAPSQQRSAHFASPLQSEELQDVTSSNVPLASSVKQDDENDSSPNLSETLSTTSTPSSSWTLPSISIQDLVYTPQTELISGILVLLSCSLTAFSTLPDLPPFFYHSLIQWEEGIAFFLFLEFVAEWWYNIIVPPQDAANGKKFVKETTSANGQGPSLSLKSSKVGSFASFWAQQWSYFTKPLVLIDVVVVVLPVVLPLIPDTWFPNDIIGFERLFDEEIPGDMAGSGLINLRLLRLLRWQRVLQDLPTFQAFQSALLGVPSSAVTPIQPYQLQLARVLVSIVTLLSVSAGLIYTTERQVNPNLSDFFSALYFTLTTLTTVGFGDITPVTPQGKMVVSASILAGIAILPAQAASLVDALWKGNNQQNEETILPPITTPTTATATINEVTTTVVDPKYANGFNGANGVHATKPSPASELVEKDGTQFTLLQELELPKLDLQTRCDSCGATTHWSKANYCWSCGSKLSQP